MDQAVAEAAKTGELHHDHDVAVAVITTVGIYPDEDDFRRAADTERVSAVLEAAAKKLKLTNTADWVAKVHGKDINVEHTFRENHLEGIVEIEWHKPEAGGGA